MELESMLGEVYQKETNTEPSRRQVQRNTKRQGPKAKEPES